MFQDGIPQCCTSYCGALSFFCLCRQLSSPEPHLSRQVSVQTVVGELLTKAARV